MTSIFRQLTQLMLWIQDQDGTDFGPSDKLLIFLSQNSRYGNYFESEFDHMNSLI
jgi:hypothetical protein